MNEWIIKLIMERLLTDENLKKFKAELLMYIEKAIQDNKPEFIAFLKSKAEKTSTPIDDVFIDVLSKLI